MKKAVIVGYGNMGSKYAEQLYNGQIKALSLYGVLCRNQPGQQKIRESMPGVVVFPGLSAGTAKNPGKHAGGCCFSG